MQSQRMAGRIRVVLALLLALGLLTVTTDISRAHGGGASQLSDVPVGPFRLFVWTSPDPWRAGGEAHVTVAVTSLDPAGQTIPVADATVVIELMPVGAPERAIVLAATPSVGAGAGAGFYEGDTSLLQAGEWDVSVKVSSAAGAGKAGFAYRVLPGSQINWLLWLGSALAVLALIGYWGTRHSQKSPV